MTQAELGSLGPFFVVEVPDDGPWRRIDDLLCGDALATQVTHTRTALAARAGAPVGHRVAASTFSLGLASRLLSPTIGATLLGLEGPDPATLRWQSDAAGPVRLAAEIWVRPDPLAVVSDLLVPLVSCLAAEHGVATTIGWGNVISAVHGAARMVAHADARLREPAGRLVTTVLKHPLLADTADIGPPFVRRSCCLYYRLPGGGYCGDCILAHART